MLVKEVFNLKLQLEDSRKHRFNRCNMNTIKNYGSDRQYRKYSHISPSGTCEIRKKLLNSIMKRIHTHISYDLAGCSYHANELEKSDKLHDNQW